MRDADVLASLEMQEPSARGGSWWSYEAYLHVPLFKCLACGMPPWIDRAELPSLARMVMDHAKPRATTLAELEARIEQSNCEL